MGWDIPKVSLGYPIMLEKKDIQPSLPPPANKKHNEEAVGPWMNRPKNPHWPSLKLFKQQNKVFLKT